MAGAIELLISYSVCVCCLFTNLCMCSNLKTSLYSSDCEMRNRTNYLATEFRNPNRGFIFQVQSCPFPEKFIDLIQHFINESTLIDGFKAIRLYSVNAKNNQTEVRKMMFNRMETLRLLSVTESQIKTVDENSFEDLTRLRIIDLRNNEISVLGENIFSPCRRLKELYLGRNKIKHIPEAIFIYTEDLISLDLSYNQLTVIDSPRLFKKTTQIKNLYLEGNCISIILGNTFNKLSSLVFLNLSHNCLSFSYTSTCNGSVEIPENYFWLVDTALMSNGSVIDVRYNKITGIPLEGIRKSCIHDRCKPLKLLLSDNPISCGCDGYDLISYFQRFVPANVARSINIPNDLSCISNKNERLSLSQVSAKSVYCDLASCPNCPRMCTCLFHRNSSTVIISCLNKKMKTIPLDLPISKEDRTELWLSGNQLEKINYIPFPYMVRVLSVANNQISELPPSFTKLQNLEILELDNNNLKIISGEDVKHIQTLGFRRLTLGNNKWNCSDCRILAFRKLLINYSYIIADPENITCWGSNKLVVSIDPNFCHQPSLSWPTTLIISVGALLVIIIFFLWRKMKPKILINLPINKLDECDAALKKYDAFVSYSHEDENYVAGLVLTLESQKEAYKLCLHSRDWTPGEYIVKQMAESVSQSRASIIVLSNAYFNSRWCYSEFRIALTHMLVRRNHKVIVIWLSDHDPDKGKLDPDFRLYFSTCTYLRYNDGNLIQKLNTALSK